MPSRFDMRVLTNRPSPFAFDRLQNNGQEPSPPTMRTPDICINGSLLPVDLAVSGAGEKASKADKPDPAAIATERKTPLSSEVTPVVPIASSSPIGQPDPTPSRESPLQPPQAAAFGEPKSSAASPTESTDDGDVVPESHLSMKPADLKQSAMRAVQRARLLRAQLQPDDPELQPTDTGLKLTGTGFKPADSGLKPAESGLKPAESILKASDSESQTSGSKNYKPADSGPQHGDSGPQDADLGLQASFPDVESEYDGNITPQEGLSLLDVPTPTRQRSVSFGLDDESMVMGDSASMVSRVSSVSEQTDTGSRWITYPVTNSDSLVVIVSALYCKLLVVIGLAFPLSEVISSNIPPFYYEVFYIYLYGASILFLLYVYIFLLKDATVTDAGSTSKLSKMSSASINRIGRLLRMESRVSTEARRDPETASQVSKTSHHKPYMVLVASYGSFYLRMGAVLFGIGSMIYSGLEMGQYFEATHKAECGNVLRAVTPGLRLAFIFIQMYFVFLNASMSINKHKLLARFGLMHMVGTNLCVWLNVVIQETKHELVHLLSLYDPNHHGGERHRRGTDEVTEVAAVDPLDGFSEEFATDLQEFHAQQEESGVLTQCARSDIMGQLVDSASPFLFPCTIEYSLICAATLYVMWKNLNKLNTVYVIRDVGYTAGSEKNKKHQYSVDCARASKGLFLGILVLVASIISLILFFVLINKSGTRDVAILSASMTELVLYCVTVVAIIIGMMQIQRLRYRSESSIELDNILLVVAQTGVYLYASFDIIGSHFSNDLYSLGTSVMAIVQVTLQTMFILDASCRQAYRTNQLRDKPGREVVTFLLICNLAMWSITTFETSRSDAHPNQLHFFGFWAWTIISHVSMPLAIFYRFHSTVCLCEIWKRAYKYKRDTV
ncbi:proton channel OtopLc-like isoform X2 [Pollicipes pollicipes]|uniref:proton channel OtopLc-like isoform X2 n=1 Tax=Pollicipes pollicipes TaxID=41117 RepID=UPI0018851D5A|nr:proton channel OtopLc-like isoform X2 [Pollicipes pollicipes]